MSANDTNTAEAAPATVVPGMVPGQKGPQMDRTKIESLLAEHEDEAMLPLVIAADEAGWGDVYEYLRVGYEEGLDHGGLWQCEHCGDPAEDPAHPHHEVGCHILDDGSGCGDTILCDECYEAAVAARVKVVVIEHEDGTEEDDSALTDDEKTLAAYLDRSDEGSSRNARSMIGSYSRDERQQLHRYQDQIDAAARKRGKTVKPTHTHTAAWRGGGPGNGEYVVSPQGWHSADGDTWTDDFGRTVEGNEFDGAVIRLMGGPRNGQEVA